MKSRRIKVKNVTNFLDKITGLIGENECKPLFLKTRFGIHTFGLKFPIDVLILDKNYIITDLRIGLPPKRFFFWNPRFDNVLELPEGTISEMKIELADRVNLRIDK